MTEKAKPFIALDEEGYPLSEDTRITDPTIGSRILSELRVEKNGSYSSLYGQTPVTIESFDQPLVAQMISKEGEGWEIQLPYALRTPIDLLSLRVDEWDRFHGRTKNGIPFVLTNKAQAHFFNEVDAFDDDSITVDGKVIPIPALYEENPNQVSSDHWNHVYVTEGKPGWDLAGPAEALKDMLPRLKLSKRRILVLGCGEGHDAAHFAKEGHVVTAIDLAPEAIRRGQAQYGHLSNLKFLLQDGFTLGPEHDGAYDLIFEHTFYCAIAPHRRRELVNRWWRWLTPGGNLMAIFFAVDQWQGPPFGSTEWELRERLRKNFRFLFWGRWKQSPPRRHGKELFVYAEKIGG